MTQLTANPAADGILIDVPAGTTLRAAIVHALEIAKNNSFPVRFLFNGTTLRVDPSSITSQIMADFWTERRRKLYAPSDGTSKNLTLSSLDATLDKLPSAGKDLKSLVAWIELYLKCSTPTDIANSSKEVLSHLEAMGYRVDEFVGDASLHSSSDEFARWLIGQFMNDLESGMPPNELSVVFAQRYLQSIS